MKHKFLQDLGIEVDEDTKELLNQFDLNGFLDQESDNRLKEETEKVEELKKNIQKKDDNN